MARATEAPRAAGGGSFAGAPLPTGAFAAAGALAGVVDLVAGLARGSSLRPSLALGHLYWGVGLLVLLGLAIDALVSLGRLAEPRLPRGARHLAWALAGIAAAELSISRNFERQAHVLFEGAYAWGLHLVFALGTGLAVAFARSATRWLARRGRWAALPMLAALGGLVANELVFPDDYAEAHAAVVGGAALVLATTLEPRLARRANTPLGRKLLLAAALPSLVAALVAPPNSVRLALFASPGSAGAWIFAQLAWAVPELEAPPDPSVDPAWLASRGALGARAPSPPLLPAGRAPVVVFVTIDALRADVVNDAELRRTRLPNFERLAREGALFTRARSPGSQTAVSLSAVFSGKTFSLQRWAMHGVGSARFEYPAADPTPRFPALLEAAGVPSFKVASLLFLREDYGVAAGFSEEQLVSVGRQHARAANVTRALVDRLRDHGAGPLFVYAHYTEPHSPYDRGALRSGSDYERYFSEVVVADEHLGRLLRALESKALRDRAILVVSSDHGEAFGEHGTTEHTKTLYEELLRVPLVVWGRGVVPRTIDTPVTLVDLGPTFLDLYGQPTPSWFVGESLVPLLAGRDVEFRRPIVAEGRLRRAMYVGDLKVSVDLRRKTIEAYDLSRDPGELVELSSREPERVGPALAALRRFFEVHAYAEGGYVPPYKP